MSPAYDIPRNRKVLVNPSSASFRAGEDLGVSHLKRCTIIFTPYGGIAKKIVILKE